MSDPHANNIDPLPADPARQADSMLRACEYQILQTVSAWLDLGAEEWLVVEGAEDLDIHTVDDAEAVQVKSSPKPISLGNGEVQEALNNFWRLRTKTPSRRVKFRFLTRAAFTVERGNPFGKGIAGLELWKRPKLGDQAVQMLATFLAKQKRLLPSFRQWLATATCDQVRADLLGSITWETHADDSVFVERSIHTKLAAFGQTQGIATASDCKRVARRLVAEVWKALRNPPPRYLDQFRLVELWEEETRINVHRSTLEASLRLGSPAPVAAEVMERFERGAPPLPGPVVLREPLATVIRERIAASGLVDLHGSTRMGKTTLAKLVIASDAANWSWWSATRRNRQEIERTFSALTLEVARSPKVVSVLLDDLDLSPNATRGFEDSLGELIATVRGRRGRVLITSHKPLPVRLQIAFGLSAEHVIGVPRLELNEVTELAELLGCNDEGLRIRWAKYVHARTGGHSQLVAVRLFALRERGWPGFAKENLGSGDAEMDAEKADARLLLCELAEAQQTMLYRLSVFPRYFRRSHAVAIGGTPPPPLTAPGDLFDPLVGPWIEPLHAGYFALSPLIADCGEKAFTVEQFRILRKAAAHVLMETEPRSTIEGADAFRLLWETRDEGGLVGMLMACAHMDRKLFAHLADDLWWFTALATKEGERLFPEHLNLSRFLRELQFQIAVAAAPQKASVVFDAWRWEIENGPQREEALARLMLAVEVLPQPEIVLPARTVVALLRDIAVALKTHPEMPVPELPSEIRATFGYLRGADDLVSSIAFTCTQRCNSVEFLDEFISCLQSVDPELRRRILMGFIGDGIGARLAIDRAWLAESDLEAPDWPRCLRVLERTFGVACEWDLPDLASATMRGIAIVTDEYLSDHQGAHAAIERLVKMGGLDSHHVHDRRASVYFSEGNFSAAEEQWKLALSRWPPRLAPFDHHASFAARSAGIAAARQGRWDAAADWFREIIKRLPNDDESENVWLVAGAYADAGFALWKAGRPPEAIGALIEAWRRADTLPQGKEDLRAFHIRKIVGHVIAWIHGTVTDIGTEGLLEPLPGMCSSADLPEKIRELPEGERGGVWVFLMRLERACGAGDLAAHLGSQIAHTAKNPAIRSIAAHEDVTQSLATGEVKNLPSLIIADASAARESAKLFPDVKNAGWVASIDPETFQAKDSKLGCSAFLAALVAASTRGHSWLNILSDWRTVISAYPRAVGWQEWFDTIERVLGGSVEEAAAIASTAGVDWAEMMLSNLNLLFSPECPPREVFLAHIRWLDAIRRSPWLRETGVAFCQLVEGAWKRAIQKPALLSHPRVNVPAIESACTAGGPGIQKAARILLAANPAVSVRVGPNMVAYVRSLAEP